MSTVPVFRDVRKSDKLLQLFASAGMSQPSVCLCLNLPNSFPSNAEVLSHLVLIEFPQDVLSLYLVGSDTFGKGGELTIGQKNRAALGMEETARD